MRRFLAWIDSFDDSINPIVVLTMRRSRNVCCNVAGLEILMLTGLLLGVFLIPVDWYRKYESPQQYFELFIWFIMWPMALIFGSLGAASLTEAVDEQVKSTGMTPLQRFHGNVLPTLIHSFFCWSLALPFAAAGIALGCSATRILTAITLPNLIPFSFAVAFSSLDLIKKRGRAESVFALSFFLSVCGYVIVWISILYWLENMGFRAKGNPDFSSCFILPVWPLFCIFCYGLCRFHLACNMKHPYRETFLNVFFYGLFYLACLVYGFWLVL